MSSKDEILNQYAALSGASVGSPELVLSALYPATGGAELLLDVAPSDFSASHIARAVEDADRHLVNLNVMGGRYGDTGRMLVALRIDSPDGLPDVVRSLERYGFSIAAASSGYGGDISDEESRMRVAELLHILEL
ncbi:MAG: hypothetical protein HDS75_07430 [Bacteroidales bacterium]|nr:hypothetical protein [Bacteroidales bacterium]